MIYYFRKVLTALIAICLKHATMNEKRTGKEDPFPLESPPGPVFDLVMSYLSYHEMSLLQRADQKFNSSIQRLLNKGFRSAERFHAKYL